MAHQIGGVVERGFAWTGRCRRLTRDYERVQTTLEGLHDVAFALLALNPVPPYSRSGDKVHNRLSAVRVHDRHDKSLGCVQQ
jgi:hypothetical protein